MPFPELGHLISSLQSQAQKLRDESDRRLLQATCSGTATIISVIIGWLCALHWYTLFSVTTGAILASVALIPLSLLIASKIWDKMLTAGVRSGDPFKRLRYLEYEYLRDMDRIQKSPLSVSEKKQLFSERHRQLMIETAPVRELIKNLTASSPADSMRAPISRPTKSQREFSVNTNRSRLPAPGFEKPKELDEENK